MESAICRVPVSGHGKFIQSIGSRRNSQAQLDKAFGQRSPRMAQRLASGWLRLAIGAAALALGACSQPTVESFRTADETPEMVQASRTVGQADQTAPTARMAITHSFILRLPAMEVEATQQRHLAECSKLGCTVLSTRLDRGSEGRVSARVSVRIAPDAYQTFAGILAAAPSEVTSHSQTAEDKTLPILDLDKRLESKIALRERLTAMLRDSGAKTTADLIAIEKELATVQSDIEAATAQRDYLRTITDTVKVDIIYDSEAVLTGGIDYTPIRRAVSNAGRTAVDSVAALISFLAAVVPWLPLVALVGWVVRRGFRRWRARKA